MPMRGRFVTFEGIDGSGKSTQLQAVARALQSKGVPVVCTREPGGTELGEALRALILKHGMSALTETLMMFAARGQHVDEVIAPSLGAGRWVLCDRFTDATYAYQCGGRGVAVEWVHALESWVHPALQPDLSIVIDLDPTEAAARRAAARPADRFESEDVAFFERVRNAYLQRAAREPARFIVIDGALSAAEIQQRILERLGSWHA
jgi:dTMP kinase